MENKDKEIQMTMKHTKGPWQLGASFTERVGQWDFDGFPISARGQAIARVWNGMPNGKENAHLIAAAPDLLKALKTLLKGGAASAPMKLKAAAIVAIAKAERRTEALPNA